LLGLAIFDTVSFAGVTGIKRKQSGIEILKGIRSLVDERVDSLEKGLSGKGKKKATKIKVD